MRNLKRTLIPGLVSAVGAFGLVLAGSADAATASLPIASFYQIVTDMAHGHLFISQGSSSQNDILVTDLGGKQVGVITGQNGVMGIALSPDGSTLYAALSSSHAVTAIDTSTLQQTASYSIGNGNTPKDVAVQSGKVWVSYDTGTAGAAAIGDIDLTATSPAFETQANMGGWSAAPEISGDPQDTGVLVAAEPSATPSTVASYNTTVDPATVRASSASFSNCENQSDLAVAPGGSVFVLACGWPYAHYRYSTADLSSQGSYASTTYPDAVAIDTSGDVAAGTANGALVPQDLFVYHQDSSALLNSYTLAGYPAPRGLAWAPDGSQLFAVVNTGGGYALQVILAPTLPRSTLTLAGPSTAYLGGKVTLSGTLMLGSSAAPTGTHITVARSITGGTTKNFDVTTGASGKYALTDTPPALGKYTYTASYSGNSSSGPATASKAVTITRKPVSLTLSTGSSTFTYKPTVRVTAHLGATYTNRAVSIYARPFGSATRKLLKTAKVSSSGNVTVSYVAPHSTTFSAVFTGDARYAPKTVTHVVYVRARVSESLSGYYSSTTIGGVTYRLFHRSKLLHVGVTVSPNKAGQCVKIEAQEYYRGAWHPNVITGCGTLNASSHVAGTFRLTRANLGYHYRMRANYIRRISDTSNLSNISGWQYFIVRR